MARYDEGLLRAALIGYESEKAQITGGHHSDSSSTRSSRSGASKGCGRRGGTHRSGRHSSKKKDDERVRKKTNRRGTEETLGCVEKRSDRTIEAQAQAERWA